LRAFLAAATEVGLSGISATQASQGLSIWSTITAVSVIVAVVVGGLETLNLIGDQLGLTDGGGFWGAIGSLNDNFGVLGYVIVGIFVVAWLISYVVYRVNRYDEIEASPA
jgi:high-affinity nickel-transport protein